MPNVTSETQRKWWWNDDFGDFFLLLLLWILATFSSCFCRGFCCCCWSPDGKTPWQWRTAKPQNGTPKMPNVTSETHRKWWFWRLFPLAAAMNFGYLVLLLLQRLLLLLLPVPGWENTIAPKNSLMSLCHFWNPQKTQILATFSFCFLLLLLLLLLLRLLLFKTHLPDGKTPWQWRTEKPQNGTPKMPNVTSETQRKWWWNDDFGDFFLLLLLWILATFSSCFCRGFCCCCWSPDGKTPWQWRTAQPQNGTPKMPITHRKWWFWRLFPLAAAMNFSYLVLLLLQRLLLLLLLVPGWENTIAQPGSVDIE